MAEFPYEEIRRPDGDYFQTKAEALLAGYDENQIWSVVHGDDGISFGPPHHWVNLLGYVATKERHDSNTYFDEFNDEESDHADGTD